MAGHHTNGHISNRTYAPGTIHVDYLLGYITRHDLMQYFSRFGRVVQSKVVNAVRDEKRAFNYGFVTFCDFTVVDRLIDYRYKRQHFIKGDLVIVSKAFRRRDTYVGTSYHHNYHHMISDWRQIDDAVPQETGNGHKQQRSRRSVGRNGSGGSSRHHHMSYIMQEREQQDPLAELNNSGDDSQGSSGEWSQNDALLFEDMHFGQYDHHIDD